LRPGELYALRWSDVDARGLVHIRRAHWHGHEGVPKTGDPREVALADAVVDVLAMQRRQQLETQHRGLAEGLVFPSDTGTMRVPASLAKALEKARRATDIEVHVTPQVLRRTFNTLMVTAGIDRIVLRAMIGHVSETMTERYAGVPAGAKHAAVRQTFGGKSAVVDRHCDEKTGNEDGSATAAPGKTGSGAGG
jgi:integrase